jgi:glycosyltransferase involved in cell wall biosynthesis
VSVIRRHQNGVVDTRAEPKVSAIIPAYNAERFLGQAIGSVLAQTHPVSECIVVDDGSTDGTAAVAERHGDRVRLIRQPNAGVAAARNRGAREARGELLAFLDADDRWLPERVERQVEALRSRPGVEAVVCATRVVNGELEPLGVLEQDPTVTPDDMLLCRARVVSTSSNLLIKRSAFERIGGFDKRLSTSADWALMFRLVAADTLAVLSDPLVEYRVHGTNMSSNVARFEGDMLAAFDGIFDDPDTPSGLRGLRRRAYANLHRMIAGSYFVQRRYRSFGREAVRSIAAHPSTLSYFVALPLRRMRRVRSQETDPFTTLHAGGTPPA